MTPLVLVLRQVASQIGLLAQAPARQFEMLGRILNRAEVRDGEALGAP